MITRTEYSALDFWHAVQSGEIHAPGIYDILCPVPAVYPTVIIRWDSSFSPYLFGVAKAKREVTEFGVLAFRTYDALMREAKRLGSSQTDTVEAIVHFFDATLRVVGQWNPQWRTITVESLGPYQRQNRAISSDGSETKTRLDGGAP